jgi:hypothetical protein
MFSRLLWSFRYWVVDACDWLANIADDERERETGRDAEALKVLSQIATGKIKPDAAQRQAYAALY